ncbi:MAG: tRNA (guanosine(37)-N1)-methyltransferase TrmD [Verrucomicrobiota bacterium]
MKIDVISLFPEMMDGVLNASILKRAQEQNIAKIRTHDLREFAEDKHRTVDDRPFGGGPGMVLKCEPLVRAIEEIKKQEDGSKKEAKIIYLTPEGRLFDQSIARELVQEEQLILVSGHYEGIDERVRECWIDEELSIGDYVLTNGVLPVLIVIDAIVRLLPGVLGNEESAAQDSFGELKILEGPHYTRPAEFRGMQVPKVLLDGNHAEIDKWRQEQGLKRTRERRKDLITKEKKEIS